VARRRRASAAAATGQVPSPVSLPVAFTTFPGEIFRVPRGRVEQACPTSPPARAL